MHRLLPTLVVIWIFKIRLSLAGLDGPSIQNDVLRYDNTDEGGVISPEMEIGPSEGRQDRHGRLESAVKGITREYEAHFDNHLHSLPVSAISARPPLKVDPEAREQQHFERASSSQDCSSSITCEGFSPRCMSAGSTQRPGALYSFAKDGNRLSVGRRHDSPGRPYPVDGANQLMRFVSAGGHSIAIDEKGTLWTWGRNDSAGGGGFGSPAMQSAGQLGASRLSDSPKSVAAPLLNTEQMIATDAGRYHSAAIGTSGTVYTWGLNDFGQLGRDAVNSSGAPCTSGGDCHDARVFPVAGADKQFGSDKAIAVAAGRYHTVVAMQSGLVYTAGLNFCGAGEVHASPTCKFAFCTSTMLGVLCSSRPLHTTLPSMSGAA
jgi:hypothetical protein